MISVLLLDEFEASVKEWNVSDGSAEPQNGIRSQHLRCRGVARSRMPASRSQGPLIAVDDVWMSRIRGVRREVYLCRCKQRLRKAVVDRVGRDEMKIRRQE